MKLIIEAAHKAGIIKDDPNAMRVDGGFIVRNISIDDDNLKKLKSGSRFYFYIDDNGEIGHSGGIFKNDPTGNEVTNVGSFKDAASEVFLIEPTNSIFGTSEQQHTHKETMGLLGSRLLPSYLEIKKVVIGSTDFTQRGGRVLPYAFISGRLYRVKDPRLDYLSPSESTVFGNGTFNETNVKALPSGNFLHLVLSPYANTIEKIVDEQKEAFTNYSNLYSSAVSDPAEKELWVSKYEHTRKLLKPHANEIYKYKDGFIYYINSGGNWQCESVSGLRDLDLDDRSRVNQYLTKGIDLSDKRKTLSHKSLQDQKKIENIAAALQPSVNAKQKKDEDDIDRRLKKLDTLRPTDGPLGTNDLAGLKEGVTLFPHQSMILAGLKDRPRMLVDADPGAGKALVIICDILQQMKLGKLKRPLVLMPESLLPQFAREVKHFSELNPWIISTESIKKWGKTGELPEFIEDAKRSPRNTVFLTSYTWISLEPEFIDNGEISEDGGKIGYRKTKVFNRVATLINKLGIDAVYQDECHLLRGSSNMARAAAGLAELPIIRGLTGTVMPSTPYDVTAPMSYIHSSVFGTNKDFIKDHTEAGSLNNYKKDAPKQIRKKLKEFGVLSVRKSAWSHLLPKVHREYHYAEFTADQKKAYTALLVNILDEIRKDPKLSVLLKKVEESLDRGDDLDVGPLLARFTPLDVFLNSPAEAKDWLKPLMLGDNAISPKAKVINSIIHKHLAKPDSGKVIVFCSYKEAAKNLMENISSDLKPKSAYYEGGMVDVLANFKDPTNPLTILFAVDKSLVVGHNLQAANCIIHADLKWVSGDIFQRESRAARIGQKRDVYIHTVIMKGSAEVLKMARLISSDHMIAKANSDFEDDTVLQPIKMSLSNMQSFTEDHQLHPYLERKKSIEASVEKQAVKEKDLYGPTMMRPHGYTSIGKVFKEAKELKKLPSSRDFVGNTKDYDALVEQDLNELPTDPTHPKSLSLSIMQWDNSWYLYSYKSSDPEGFLRRLGFSLMRGYYYIELQSKANVGKLVEAIEKSLTISNKLEFENNVRETRVSARGIKSGLKRASQKARIAAKVEDNKDFVDKSNIKGEIELEFSVMGGVPVVWVYDMLSSNDPELSVLKRVGFEQEPAFWKRQVTRSSLKLLFNKILTNYPQVRIANWDEFKSIAHQAFKGLDLTEFDNLELKKK